MKEKLVIGIIRTSYGIKGELKVKSLSGETAHFLALKYIYLKKKEVFCRFHVEKIRIKSNTIFLKLEGIDTPEKGRELNGSKIWVDRENACPLEDNEYYYGDLTQCDVFKENIHIGKVKNVIETGTVFLLEVQSPHDKTIMIPLSDEYIDDIYIQISRIII